MIQHHWTWPARCLRVIDGDTVELLIDRGFRGTSRERVRLIGVNAPEVVGADRAKGLAAKGYVLRWFNPDHPIMPSEEYEWPLVIETYRPYEHDAWGRWLARLWRASDGRCLNDDLVAAGHAVPYP